MRPSYLFNGSPYTGKMVFWYWIRSQGYYQKAQYHGNKMQVNVYVSSLWGNDLKHTHTHTYIYIYIYSFIATQQVKGQLVSCQTKMFMGLQTLTSWSQNEFDKIKYNLLNYCCRFDMHKWCSSMYLHCSDTPRSLFSVLSHQSLKLSVSKLIQ